VSSYYKWKKKILINLFENLILEKEGPPFFFIWTLTFRKIRHLPLHPFASNKTHE